MQRNINKPSPPKKQGYFTLCNRCKLDKIKKKRKSGKRNVY